MTQQSDLFDSSGKNTNPSDPPALSVSQFNERVAAYLKGLFPGVFRIQGFVSGFNRSFARGGHVYFELHEKDPEEETRDIARISLVIWRGTRQRLLRDIEALGGAEGELDDLQVFFEVSVNFWVQGGRLSLMVEGIDVEASLGAQKLDRERILRRLEADGLLDKNKQRHLPAVPLGLVLITSLESAAYHDFIKELSHAGMGFKLACIDARVQGPEQEPDMQAAFEIVSTRFSDWDAAVLIRGGGSRADLMGFDSESLARSIAHCPLPVLTGIGHEIDRSIADEVAHRALKTPTAVAQHLVQVIEEWLGQMETMARDLRREAERGLLLAARRLDRSAHRIPVLVRGGLSAAARRASVVESRLPGSARQILRLARVELRHRSESFVPTLRGRLAVARQELEHCGERFAVHARERLARESREVDHRDEQLRLLDPMNILQRGFSLTRDARGRLLRSASALSAGDVIVTQLADGKVESRAEKIHPGGPEKSGRSKKRKGS